MWYHIRGMCDITPNRHLGYLTLSSLPSKESYPINIMFTPRWRKGSDGGWNLMSETLINRRYNTYRATPPGTTPFDSGGRLSVVP